MFPIKGQIVNILSFAGLPVTVIPTNSAVVTWQYVNNTRRACLPLMRFVEGKCEWTSEMMAPGGDKSRERDRQSETESEQRVSPVLSLNVKILGTARLGIFPAPELQDHTSPSPSPKSASSGQ